MSGDLSDDTEPQPVLRLGADGVDPADPAADPAADPVEPPAAGRRGGRWLVAAATAGVVALGATGYLLTRQAPAAAQPPPTTSSSTPGPGPATESPSAATTIGAPLPAGEATLVLGDSLALIVYPYLADLVPDRYVSYVAEVGSSTAWAVAQLEQLRAQGEKLPKVVVVSAGTNDWYADEFATDAARLMDLLGPRRCVVWSTLARPDIVAGTSVTPAGDMNSILTTLAAEHSNLRILDWAGETGRHPDWLGGDGIHPGEDGARVRAQMFADASLACSPIDPEAPVADKQYLPDSAFWGGSPTTGSTATSGSGEAPAYPSDPTPKPTRTKDPKPSRTPEPEPTKTRQTPQPTQTPEEPPPPPPPPPSPTGAGDG